MFWVESRLRVCTWDPAHGKPYASAQLALSFGVEGEVGACFHIGTVQIEPGRLELYPYRTFIESSEEKEAVLTLVLSRIKLLLYVTPAQRSKVSGISSVSHHWGHFMKIGRCVVSHKDVSPFYQVGCLTHQLLPPSPPSFPPPADLSLYPQRG